SPASCRLCQSLIPLLDLDFDVDAGGKIELGQRIDRGRARVKNVDQPLVRLQLELLARLLVNVRRAQNCPPLRLCRQRNRTTYLRARLLGRADDVRRGLIDDGVVKRLEPNSNSSCHIVLSVGYLRIFVTTPAPTVRPPSRIAKRRPSSMAIGVISSIVICTLSPGITISIPSGSSTDPVTSVVLKQNCGRYPLKNGVCRPPSSFVSTYTSAVNCVCGVIEPGLASTIPRSMSSLLMPRRSRPTLSP